MKEFESRGSEGVDLPFMHPESPDVLVVLGRNLVIGESAKTIKERTTHLSMESKMNTIIAGWRWSANLHNYGTMWKQSTKIVFATGITTPGLDSRGKEVKSEAREMAEYMKKKFPHIPDENIILEETSIDTAGNAEEVAKILTKEFNRPHVDIVCTSGQSKNAVKLFEKFGVKIGHSYKSDVEIRDWRHRFYTSHRHYDSFVNRWNHSPRVMAQEKVIEGIRTILLHTIDPKGEFLRKVTSRTRG